MKTKIIPSKVVYFVTLVAMIVVVSVSTTAQEKPQLVDWLLGEWAGTRENIWCEWDATSRITAYDQATQAFKGDGYLVVQGECGAVPSHTDLVIKGVIDDEGRVVMTTHHSSGWVAGRSFTFNLKRERDGRLSGTETHGGSDRLTLKKKQ